MRSLAIVITIVQSLFLSLSSVFCFWPTSGNLPMLKICFPQYLSITIQVTIVVNFDLPVDVTGTADCETYLHRYDVLVENLTCMTTFILAGLEGPEGSVSTGWLSTWWMDPSLWGFSSRLRDTSGRILSSWMRRYCFVKLYKPFWFDFFRTWTRSRNLPRTRSSRPARTSFCLNQWKLTVAKC